MPDTAPLQHTDRGNYAHARYMTFDTRPVSVEAASLTEDIAGQIEAWETKDGRKTYRRTGKKQEQFRWAVALFVGDLVSAARHDLGRWSFHSVGKSCFTGKLVSYRTFKAIFDSLSDLGLIEVHPGSYKRIDAKVGFGHATRLRGMPLFFQVVEGHGIKPRSAPDHFQQELPSKPLVLKTASTRWHGLKLSGQVMKIEENDKSRRLEEAVREINSYLAQQDIQGGTHRGYRRIFNRGDTPDFDWNKGGRLYSQGEDSYQLQKKEDRLAMLINDEPVAEIDVTASYLTILYALHGLQIDRSRDAYDIDGLPRSVVKSWVTITLGWVRFHDRWPPETVKRFKEKEGYAIGKKYRIKNVQEAVTAAHPILKDWPDQSWSCFDLMYMESRCITGAMIKLRYDEIPCLSVHDSIIVPRSMTRRAARTLIEAYQVLTHAGHSMQSAIQSSLHGLLAPPRGYWQRPITWGQTGNHQNPRSCQ